MGTGCVAAYGSVGGVRARRRRRGRIGVRSVGGVASLGAVRSVGRLRAGPDRGRGLRDLRRSARVHRASRGRAGPTDSSRRVRARARWSWGGFCPLDEATDDDGPGEPHLGDRHGCRGARRWVPRRARPPVPSRWPARCAPARASGRPSGSRQRRPTARPRRRRRRWRAGRCGGTAAPRGAAAPAGRGRRDAGRGPRSVASAAPSASSDRPQVARHRRRTGEGAAQAALLGDLVGAEPGRRRGGGPTPTAGRAGRRPAAYSASSSPWHCTRMASVIRSPRRGDG